MSATNKTTNYELPVFVGTDKPAWLVDWNSAMNDIDTAIKEAKTAGDNAQTTANTATSDISTLSGSVSTLSSSVSTLSTNVSTNTGSINTITSLIGNGEPTTTDKTIIGAINEIKSDIESFEDDVNASYSTTERSTGRKWTDGKDIFEKVVTGKLEASEVIGDLFRSDNTLITGVETLIKAYGHFERSSGVQSFIGSTQYASSGDMTSTSSIVTNSGSVLFAVINNNAITANTNNFTVVLEYTKVTTP